MAEKQQSQPTFKDLPTAPSMGFGGYQHYKDQTMLPSNILTYPTRNFFIPNSDKAVVRKGSHVIGGEFTTILFYSALTGIFHIGDIITGATSGATAIVVYVLPGNFLALTNIIGNFNVTDGEVINVSGGAHATMRAMEDNGPIIGHSEKFASKTGQVMEIRAFNQANPDDIPTVTVYQALWTDPDGNGEKQWVTFAPTPVEQLPDIGGKRIFFTEWWDADTEIIITPGDEPTPNGGPKGRLIWADGTTTIRAWSGAIAKIRAISGNDITIEATYSSWNDAGFDGGIRDTLGNRYFVINGIKHPITGDLATDTITLNNVVGIQVGDLVADYPNETLSKDDSIFDFAKAVENHVVYGNYKTRQLFGSNAFAYDPSVYVNSVSAVQDDLIISDIDLYSATTVHTLKFVINQVALPPERTFSPSSIGEVDDLVFTGTHTGDNRDHYVIVISAPGPSTAFNVFYNGALIDTGVLVSAHLGPANTYVLPNGVELYFTGFSGHAINSGWEYYIGGLDQFAVYVDGETTPSFPSIPIYDPNPDYPFVYNNVIFSFGNATGHALGDTWNVTLEPVVNFPWADFYYSVPTRKPGQGFIAYLPSNFWTMEVQEDVLYINDQSGKWVTLELILSADLLTETIKVNPLKYESSLQAIFPYMLGYFGDYLCFITMDKTLKIIGRKKFLQLPQTGNLSDPVKLDFDALSFKGGSIKYFNDRLHLTSPQNVRMMVFDKLRGYWQPPQEIPECGILSIITVNSGLTQPGPASTFALPTETNGDYLIAHSNIRNQTNVLFIGTNDNGEAFTTKLRTGALSFGARWNTKWANMTFIEGNMIGLPTIFFSLIMGPNGCEGIEQHKVAPIMCIPSDNAPIGQGALGSHPLGSDEQPVDPYYRELYPFQMKEFYYVALDLESSTLDQRWSVNSLGVNAIMSQSGNSQLTKDIPILLKRN